MDYSEDQNKGVGYMWKSIYSHQNTDKSTISRGTSSRKKKYTPLKETITPEKALKISSLKSGLSDIKIERVRTDDGEESGKSRLKEHRSILSLIKRMGDENKEESIDNITEIKFSQREKKHAKKHSIFKNEPISSLFIANETEPATQTIIHNEVSIDEGQKNILLRLNTLTSKKSEEIEENVEKSDYAECNIFMSIEEIFRKCLEMLHEAETTLQTKRIEIQRVLEEKQLEFLQIKEKMLTEFAKREKEIQQKELREVLKDYIPSEVKQPLMRVTSERIFNRNMRNNEYVPEISEKKSSQAFASQIAHTFDFRSVKSRESSNCKQKFDLIFGAINKIKTVLHENPNKFCISNKKEQNTQKNLEIKPMKVSLLDLRNKSDEGNSTKKLRLSQFVKDLSILKT